MNTNEFAGPARESLERNVCSFFFSARRKATWLLWNATRMKGIDDDAQLRTSMTGGMTAMHLVLTSCFSTDSVMIICEGRMLVKAFQQAPSPLRIS